MTLVTPFSRPRPGSLARYDQALLLGGLSLLVALCWWYLFEMASDMSGMSMEMSSGGQDGSVPIENPPWTISETIMIFMMWAIMMAGMMVPTAIRAIMIYARVNAQAVKRGRVVVSGYWFAFGYLVIWTLFSITVTVLQRYLDQADLLSLKMASSSYPLGTLLFISAGVWQLSPAKNNCLKHCRSPVDYIAAHYHPGVSSAIRLGFIHGAFCLGCCWLIMCLLFIGGVMNLLWIAAITGFVLAEKLISTKYIFTRMSGWMMIVTGIAYFLWNWSGSSIVA